jgi:hypothetical protein
MKLFEDHAFLIFLGLALVIGCYTVIVIVGKPIDDRVIGTIAVGLSGGLLGFANKQ